MVFLWPGFLFLLLLIPLLILAYIWILRRRRRFTVRYSSLALVRAALPEHSRWRRHVPFALFLLALGSLAIGVSRPVFILSVPTDQTTIILAIDVSGSMRSRDIPPSRLQAAEAAAMAFIQHQKASTQIGLVAFSGFGELIQPPTTDQEALQTALESLTVGRRTAVGAGILTSIDAIAQVDRNVPPSQSDANPGIQVTPVPPGDYAPDIIVLLTDGVSNAGPDPIGAAQQATDRGVRVYTIGFGTANGFIPFAGTDPFGNSGGGGFFGNSGGGGFGFRTGIDDVALKQIASMTGGSYHPAASADELEKVFNSLPTYLITKHEISEISVAFAALGALLAVLAVGLSLAWHPLP